MLASAQRSENFRGTLLRLVKQLTPQRGRVAVVMLLGVAGIAVGVIGPRILGHATDLLFNGVLGRGLPTGITREQAVEAARARGDNTFADLLAGSHAIPGQGVDFDAIGRVLTIALLLYLVSAVMVWAEALLLNSIVQRTMHALRAHVEDKIHRLPLSYFDSRPRGEILSRVTNDIDNVQTSLTITVSQLLTSALTVLAVLAAMLWISPLLALITVLTVPFTLLATRLITKRSRQHFMAQWRNTGRLNAHIEETYSGFTVVKTFGHRALAEEKFRELNNDVYQASFGAQSLSGLVAPITTFIGNISYVGVAVVGGIQVATGQISLGSIQAFIQYVRQFNQPLTQIASMYNTLQSGIASAERVFEFLDADDEVVATSAAGAPTAPLPADPDRVEFDRVNFSYRPGTPVIEDLSFIAEPGSTVAIVGPTGAGKTTLVNLLMRFYEPDSGRILVGGREIAAMSRDELRSRIGMVLQDTWLIGGTIYDNIAYGRPDATEAEVIEAARTARVDHFVHTLPNGYQTRLNENGVNISAGEKQLITIARALLRQPQLLILDEATSSVDSRTELLIAQATAELRRNRTSFIIAHRLSTIRDADLILVVQAGRIVERGSHDELLERRGAYWEMTRA
ncbi:ABC transporter ATP-binding protein [Mycobacterium sp. CBMA293]|uniref:ABC transporter ATP-binding protein n=1 Tax=unclassified Mycolicibacterium TaxID=2636767 RepID=UPI0012DC66CF|nr:MULTISPECIES: ABC transporter ATP-binding protein [unclassified Mycolicibacterium]MUL46019.1 ABC transporter ATP-binding protein [Mycolicibacterium sp. CBMA 360]MUL60691.1 ABC transporter ATP-binding protein [Mycolicibacterium sp. CBMA 335]MUL72506.1 ABC transporter ATP-binding protein [Mycolicibacterium sp. CBMA 311]MUL95093.1 ABC transporter ATP-binding protein [Mycolicibacterium sp. CBMA 230]MUM07089.1 ABC transporter ATP-binding protein [Mycolicibacterium sp. CBMA 213]